MRDDAIVVVTGLPRSGTSLLLQMLVAGGLPALCDAERPPDPDNPRGYFELAAVKASARDTSWVARAPGHAVKVIHALLAHLPLGLDLRVIALRRPIGEVLRSQAAMLVRRGAARAPADDARLGAAMERQLDAALRAVALRPAPVLQVDYPALVGAPAAGAERIAAFLERDLDVAAMAAAVDPMLHRQRA